MNGWFDLDAWNFKKRFMNRSRNNSMRDGAEYYRGLIAADKEEAKFRQEIEDRKFEMAIENEGNRLYLEWEFAPIITLEVAPNEFKDYRRTGIVIVNPSRGCYTIYDEETAKHLKSDFNALVFARRKQLIEEYEARIKE